MTTSVPAPFALRTEHPPAAYLAAGPLIDLDHPAIRDWLAANPPAGRSDIEIAADTYRFVRDMVPHSCDIDGHRVTAGASDVLQHREGICWAKSHLLAALLRGQGIPTGCCYRRLVLADQGLPTVRHCVHGLNSGYLASLGRWVRLDARGNKPGVDAQFRLDGEQLAFALSPEDGEFDYSTNYPQPAPDHRCHPRR